jgi:aryl-alcohol dehydrogenase-like predicted oxidoreductase
MNRNSCSRRHFLKRAGLAAGAVWLAPQIPIFAQSGKPRTAVDQVTLGNTGIKLSRLGFGTGSNSGEVQKALGKAGFRDLIHYAYDKGITYFDCAQSYQTFGWIGESIKGLPREKIFLQSKVMGKPEKILEAIDQHRKVFDTDYVDSLLVHCMVQKSWTDDWKRIMDGFAEAKEKKWIRAKGVSCHSLPALRAATESPWTEVHLVRVNPQASHVDGEDESWDKSGDKIEPVMVEIKKMRAKGRGIIGMKIIGNGDFQKAEDREKSIRFAMAQPELDAVVIGFKSRAEIDEAIERMNRALAEQKS